MGATEDSGGGEAGWEGGGRVRGGHAIFDG